MRQATVYLVKRYKKYVFTFSRFFRKVYNIQAICIVTFRMQLCSSVIVDDDHDDDDDIVLVSSR